MAPRLRVEPLRWVAPGAARNLFPHPASSVPHRVFRPVAVVAAARAARDAPGRFVRHVWALVGRPWPAIDLVLWSCVTAWAFLDIVTTAVGLESGLAAEANRVGALAYGSGGALALLQLKLAVLLFVAILWIAVPWRWRPYVRAGTVAGGAVTFAAAAHNAWILLAVH